MVESARPLDQQIDQLVLLAATSPDSAKMDSMYDVICHNREVRNRLAQYHIANSLRDLYTQDIDDPEIAPEIDKWSARFAMFEVGNSEDFDQQTLLTWALQEVVRRVQHATPRDNV